MQDRKVFTKTKNLIVYTCSLQTVVSCCFVSIHCVRWNQYFHSSCLQFFKGIAQRPAPERVLLKVDVYQGGVAKLSRRYCLCNVISANILYFPDTQAIVGTED